MLRVPSSSKSGYLAKNRPLVPFLFFCSSAYHWLNARQPEVLQKELIDSISINAWNVSEIEKLFGGGGKHAVAPSVEDDDVFIEKGLPQPSLSATKVVITPIYNGTVTTDLTFEEKRRRGATHPQMRDGGMRCTRMARTFESLVINGAVEGKGNEFGAKKGM